MAVNPEPEPQATSCTALGALLWQLRRLSADIVLIFTLIIIATVFILVLLNPKPHTLVILRGRFELLFSTAHKGHEASFSTYYPHASL